MNKYTIRCSTCVMYTFKYLYIKGKYSSVFTEYYSKVFFQHTHIMPHTEEESKKMSLFEKLDFKTSLMCTSRQLETSKPWRRIPADVQLFGERILLKTTHVRIHTRTQVRIAVSFDILPSRKGKNTLKVNTRVW